MDLRGKRILITGANGFIGGRLAERLAQEEGARVRGLAREATRVGAKHWPEHVPPGRPFSCDALDANSSSLSESRRFPLKMAASETRFLRENGFLRQAASLAGANASPLQYAEIAIGDVTDVDAIRRAVDGCDVVVHCAALQSGRARLHEYRRVNVDGTLNLLRAARDANVARFIHISTINVHGVPPPREAHADSPLSFHGDFYSISKAEGERAAWQFARENHLPLVVIRPACTYGPRSHAWTLTPLKRVHRGRPVLIGDGGGTCNAVYIDNLIDLMLLAMKNDAAIGHAFIGAEGRGVTWREFYGAYAAMLGGKRLFGMPRAVALALTLPFELLARVDGYPPRLARASVAFYSHRVVFDISKATQMLGYAPRVSFAEGMRRTQQWLVDSGQLAVVVNGKS